MSNESHPPALTIESLYRRYAGVVLRRAQRFFSDSEAEEITHEVFLKVMERLEQFRLDSSPVTWLYRITTNHCLNRLRNQGRRRELLRAHRDSVPGTQAQTLGPETTVYLRQVWSQVDPDLLQFGVYAYVDGLTQVEIARIMGVSLRTVTNRLTQLRELLAALEGKNHE